MHADLLAHVKWFTDPKAHPTDWGAAGTARMTGIPASIALQALARGDVAHTGVMGPEAAFEPKPFFSELSKRGIVVEAG